MMILDKNQVHFSVEKLNSLLKIYAQLPNFTQSVEVESISVTKFCTRLPIYQITQLP